MRQVWAILSPEERRTFIRLQPLVVFTALLETAGLASIVPFLAVLSDPSAIQNRQMLRAVYEWVGFSSNDSFFFAVGVAVLCLVTVGNGVNALTTWALLRFAWMGSHTLSRRLLESYLARPYSYFLEHNGAELAKNILAEVNQVVTGVLVSLSNMIARAVVLGCILITLIALDPVMAVGAGAVFGLLYGAMFFAVRRRLKRDGELRNKANGQRHKHATEALAGVKELKLYGLEAVAVEAYSVPSLVFGETQARAAVTAQLPRYALESIAFGGMLVVVLGLLWRGQSLAGVMPVLGLYAFATYRMLPGLQAMFTGFTAMRFAQSALDALSRDIQQDPAHLHVPVAVAFSTEVSLKSVSFTYKKAKRVALDRISMTIRKGEWVAFIGPTGAGKSTLVDVLLGLLQADDGAMCVDGIELSAGQLRGWQRQVAYVPQQIFMVDDSIERNICFGLMSDVIDRDRMVWAARTAQIHDFIEADLSEGYQTKIGERGIRLSGGERQRIGIARALYRRPQFLVLDEATSALDNKTEEQFFASLRREIEGISVVSIAHRLSTTRDFDRIYALAAGEIQDAGSFAEMRSRSPLYQGY
jgi:ABC-type multidrug transport system fused ATPase/permease subunit